MKLLSLFQKTKSADFIAFIAGCLMTLAFAPFELYPLAILSLASLLGTWLWVTPKRAFFRGWLYGVGLFGTGIYWIYISVHTYGNASALAALCLTGILVAILALFPAVNGYFLNRYFPKLNKIKLLYAFPATWVFIEWIRTWLFSGFPWLIIGYSQINSPLRGYASVLSVFGVSLAVALSSGLLVSITRDYFQKSRLSLLKSILTLVLIWIAGGIISLIPWTKPDGAPLRVSLVQGNIPQETKWDPDALQANIERYVTLTNPHWDSQIIIWPEAAIPLPLQNAEDLINAINKKAHENNTAFITGIPIKLPNQDAYYNAVIVLGDGQGYYLKRRLVPFGEFIPMRYYLNKLLDVLNVPMSDFIPGHGALPPLTAHGAKISAFICYEIAFPEQVLTHDNTINMLLAVSNDTWFGYSIAEAQHLEMAQMRALELGRPVLFASNDGITAIVNSKGNIQSRAPQHTEYVLTDTVQPMRGKTAWQYLGMDSILYIISFMLALAFFKRKRD